MKRRHIRAVVAAANERGYFITDEQAKHIVNWFLWVMLEERPMLFLHHLPQMAEEVMRETANAEGERGW